MQVYTKILMGYQCLIGYKYKQILTCIINESVEKCRQHIDHMVNVQQEWYTLLQLLTDLFTDWAPDLMFRADAELF